jgi:GNAT superfamily N-acetyltransferase
MILEHIMEIEGNSFEFRPLISKDWDSLEKLFGKRGAMGGCWCMFWKQTQTEFARMHGEQNRLALKSVVESGTVPGVLAYQDNEPAGWCAVEPRESYSRLARAKVLAPVDDQPVWSITCFFIGKQYRRKGLMRGLLKAAIDWATSNGAHIIESYPFDTQQRVRPSTAYMGVIPVYLENGFVEVMRRTPRRPIMRKYL